MRRSTSRALSSASFIAFAAFGLAGTAMAQDTAGTQPGTAPNCEGITDPTERDRCLQGEVEIESGEDIDPTNTGETITVTGSRIRRPNLESNIPVTSVGVEELLDDGSLSLGDALNDLPSLRSTFSTANSQRFIGTTGLSLLDLRGLGTSRTLVLVNGRRHVTSQAGEFTVDVNTIPFELLQRVDVVTGGSSAVYGSDAIAGVVNFVLRRDFEGISLRGQGGISERGDRGAYFVSGMIGQNFFDDRANIALVAEYSKSRGVLNIARPEQSGAFNGFTSFIQTDTDTGQGTNSDGIPDSTLQSGIRYNYNSIGGTVTGTCAFGAARQPLICNPNGTNRFYRFDANGRLALDQPTTDFRTIPGLSASSFQIGGTGGTFADYGTLFPPVDRVTVNLLASFEVSPAFQPFIEAKYARLTSFSESSPAFSQFFAGCGAASALASLGGLSTACDTNTAVGLAQNSIPIFFDNPFINPADLPTLRGIQTELLRAAGSNATPQFFRLSSDLLVLGPRQEEAEREVYRVAGGIEGDFNGDWHYELSGTYGEFKGHVDALNVPIIANFRNAVDAVRNAQGQIVCRINADAITTNDNAACVPINILGDQRASPQALAYINTTSFYDEEASQLDITGFVSGDLSQLFELPGGAIGFVVGGEYRREQSSAVRDPFSQQGGVFFNSLANFSPPTFEVKEVFGEVRVPLLADMPFFHELEFTGAARYSDYNSGAGRTADTFAYNLNATWAPVRDIRFRGNYSQAVRSPTPGALFAQQGQTFLFLTDPCDRLNINNGTPQRVANCRSNTRLGGVPIDYTQPGGNRPALSGGNPLLEEETSRSITLGAVFTPSGIPGLSLTIDYYDIEVSDLIATPSGSAILQQCYDSDSFPNNQFCDLVGDRVPGTGNLNQTAAVTVGPVNFAALTAEGIDFDLAYRTRFDNGDRLTLRGIATWNLERTNYLDPLNPDVPNRVLSELGDPEFAANANASYTRGPFTVTYSLNYIGEQTIGTYETQNTFEGRCTQAVANTTGCTVGELAILPPLNPDAFGIGSDIIKNYPSRFIHNLRFEFQPEEKFRFYFGADNVTDQLPPFGLTGAGAGSGIFSNIGRYFYAGARIDF